MAAELFQIAMSTAYGVETHAGQILCLHSEFWPQDKFREGYDVS